MSTALQPYRPNPNWPPSTRIVAGTLVGSATAQALGLIGLALASDVGQMSDDAARKRMLGAYLALSGIGAAVGAVAGASAHRDPRLMAAVAASAAVAGAGGAALGLVVPQPYGFPMAFSVLAAAAAAGTTAYAYRQHPQLAAA